MEKIATATYSFEKLRRAGYVYVDPNEKTKAYSYEISNIEVLKGVVGFMTRPSDRTSMDVSILLNGVCDVNGEPLLK